MVRHLHRQPLRDLDVQKQRGKVKLISSQRKDAGKIGWNGKRDVTVRDAHLSRGCVSLLQESS